MEKGVHTFSDYEIVLGDFQKLQSEVSGCLSEYHLPFAMDHMVSNCLLPKSNVPFWPVAPTGRDGRGLALDLEDHRKGAAIAPEYASGSHHAPSLRRRRHG